MTSGTSFSWFGCEKWIAFYTCDNFLLWSHAAFKAVKSLWMFQKKPANAQYVITVFAQSKPATKSCIYFTRLCYFCDLELLTLWIWWAFPPKIPVLHSRTIFLVYIIGQVQKLWIFSMSFTICQEIFIHVFIIQNFCKRFCSDLNFGTIKHILFFVKYVMEAFVPVL